MEPGALRNYGTSIWKKTMISSMAGPAKDNEIRGIRILNAHISMMTNKFPPFELAATKLTSIIIAFKNRSLEFYRKREGVTVFVVMLSKRFGDLMTPFWGPLLPFVCAAKLFSMFGSAKIMPFAISAGRPFRDLTATTQACMHIELYHKVYA